MTKRDWIIAGAVLGSLFLVGVLAWAFKKRGASASRFKLVKVGQGNLKPILRNKEIIKWDDWRGVSRTIVIEREVKSVKD